jgi:hypothetical protein
MMAQDKIPTDEVLDDIAQNDTLERNHLISKFIHLLASVKGHYAIALNGRWGTGKTFFVKQTERILQQLFIAGSENKENPNKALASGFGDLLNDEQLRQCKMIPIYYDAWEHDNHQDALLSLILEIDKKISGYLSTILPQKEIMEKAKISASRVVSNLIEHFIGIDIMEVKKALENEDLATQTIRNLRNADDLRTNIINFFNAIIPNNDARMVIFVDELDRCRPDYAVQLLERVKHYMLIDNITFVFSVNISQLQHTIKRFYGDGFDANLYLNRFFDWHVLLPMPNVFKERAMFVFGSRGSLFNEWCQVLAEHFNFEIREQIHFFDSINKLLRIPDYNFGVDFSRWPPHTLPNSFLNYYFAPMALALRIHDINRFYDFIDGRYEESIELLADHAGFFTESALKMLGIDTSKADGRSELADVLKKLYNAVFNKTYLYNGEKEIVGIMEINESIKQKFIENISSLGPLNLKKAVETGFCS